MQNNGKLGVRKQDLFLPSSDTRHLSDKKNKANYFKIFFIKLL